MAAFPDDLDGTWQKAVRRRLLDWYRKHARPLPWRESADPYRVWISEIMLQQTTIAAVRPYFEEFQERFPTVQDLAAATESDVLRQWEGLGYYSRARNLHKAARMIVEEYSGSFPDDVDELRTLPGVGPYTARAIASLAFGQGVGILEANTTRLYSRLIELDEDPRSSATHRLLWEFADWVVAPRSASSFNQAAMDVGSTICTPDDPSCTQCPLQKLCCSFKSGRQHKLPRLAPKKEMTDVTEVALVLRRGQKVLMREYSDGERWAGLWDFARFSVSVEEGDQLLSLPRHAKVIQPGLFSADAAPLAVDMAQERTGLQMIDPFLLRKMRHTVTRYRIRLLCVTARQVRGVPDRASGLRWQPIERLNALPLSTTARAIADLVMADT